MGSAVTSACLISGSGSVVYIVDEFSISVILRFQRQFICFHTSISCNDGSFLSLFLDSLQDNFFAIRLRDTGLLDPRWCQT